jgi:hypothetical protein
MRFGVHPETHENFVRAESPDPRVKIASVYAIFGTVREVRDSITRYGGKVVREVRDSITRYGGNGGKNGGKYRG